MPSCFTGARYLFGAVAFLVLLIAPDCGAAPPSESAGATPFVPRPVPTFACRAPVDPALAYSRAYQWLRGRRPVDGDLLRQFNAVWEGDRSLLDKTVATFRLGDYDAADLLDAVRDPDRPVPAEVPPTFQARELAGYYRANLSLAYARELCARRAFEEAFSVLHRVRCDDVVDPAQYWFLRARAAHALMLPREARAAIDELLDMTEVPERYRALACGMRRDMETWGDKDLGWVARKMDNVARRLELGRGGPFTQKMQKEVLVRLDEMIKERQWQLKEADPPRPANPPR
jgi:hypothetical protein